MRIDRSSKPGECDPGLLNELFRSMHTLKSLGSAFGAGPITRLVHHSENLLDSMRLDRIEITSEVIGVLMESADAISDIIAEAGETGEINSDDRSIEIRALIGRLDTFVERCSKTEAGEASEKPETDLYMFPSRDILDVLTRYEEHRLRVNIERGMPIFLVRARFDIDSIGEDLDAMRSRLTPVGEIVSCIPSGADGVSPGQRIDIILALSKEIEDLVSAVSGTGVAVEQVKASADPPARVVNPAKAAWRSPVDRTARINTHEIGKTRLGLVFDRLALVAGRISKDLGKEVNFVCAGAETEMDDLLIERLLHPLMHLVRNAIDHGIEDFEIRKAAGKPIEGTVTVTARGGGDRVTIEVKDDGAGIDCSVIAKIALERGFITKSQALSISTREALELIFLPGLSSVAHATEMSGRGVGMDVVRTDVSALGGAIEVQSDPGVGTRLVITLPATGAALQRR